VIILVQVLSNLIESRGIKCINKIAFSAVFLEEKEKEK
jgi:hypothetical protein